VTAGFDQTVRLWDARTGTLRAALTSHVNQVMMARFSPDGTLVASTGLDGTKIWSVSSGGLLAESDGSAGYAGRFGPDSERLLSANLDRTVNLWDMHRDRRNATAIAQLVRCRIPFRLAGNTILPAAVDPAACRGR
jgi:WD40 repeat protein